MSLEWEGGGEFVGVGRVYKLLYPGWSEIVCQAARTMGGEGGARRIPKRLKSVCMPEASLF
jgi:hypothetical protein